MGVANIISLLSGIALFLFGMSLMGDGLKRVAGNKLERLLYQFTSSRLKGILLGTGVTAVIQSSSATSVMVVGFVNAGMMKLEQAVGVVLGAILGTSITGWIIALNNLGGGSGWVSLLSTSTLTGIISVAGILIRMLAKRATHKHVGDILLGFAVLMFGMSTMSGAVSPLKENAFFINLLTQVENPLLGILVGALFTMVIQSASAAVGILQALAVTGAITFATAFPLIMGIGIGASLPVLMSAAGSSANGKRTAVVYLLIDVIGAIVISIFFYSVNLFAHFGFMTQVMTSVSIAALNTIYRLVMVILLAPATGMLANMVCRIVKDDPQEDAASAAPQFEERFLPYPSLAIDQCRKYINEMADLTKDSVQRAIGVVNHFDEGEFRQVIRLEETIDAYEDAIASYLIKITKHELNTAQNKDVTRFLHTITDFERISDHARNVAEIAQQMGEDGTHFSAPALAELDVLHAAIGKILSMTTDAYERGDLALAAQVDPLEEVVDNLCDGMKTRHVERVKTGECSFSQGLTFNDLLTNYERMGDHCSNIAIAMIEVDMNSFQTHEYNVEELKQSNFARYYQEYSARFRLPEE